MAELGLGVFSAVISLVSSCSQIYDLWKSVRELDAELGTLRTKLLLQQALLEQWQRDWLGTAASCQAASHKRQLLKQHEATVEHTLRAVQRLLTELEPLREAACGYGASGDEKELSVFKRLQWATKKSTSSGKILDEIESLLSSLYRLFPPSTPNVHASQAILALDYLPDKPFGSSGTPATVGKAIALRQFGSILDKELERRVAEFVQVMPTASLDLDRSQIAVTGPDEISSGFRSFGVLNETTKVLIEWKKYDASWHGQKGIRLRGRIRNIAQFLHADSKPDELLTLKCVGVFDDVEHNRYGFVFSLPPNTDGKMLSLKQLLDQKTVETLPSLEDRYAVCYSIGLSLALLHTAGWLHKSIRSHNVLFPVRDSRPIWSQPYLVGFDFSRPDAIDEASEKPEQSERFNIYRHPAAPGSPSETYRKAFDVYSFGVLMVEIGLWRSASRLRTEGMTVAAFRENLTSKAEGWLAHYIGREMKTAAVKCLTGELEDRRAPVHRAFYLEVVDVLGKLTGEL